MSRRIIVAGVIAVSVIALGAAGCVWQPWRDETPPAPAASSKTAVVEKTTLSADLVLSAQLEYGAPIQLVGTGGLVTQLPHPGDIVAAGQPLYEVDGMPVIAFVGDRPLWRPLEAGIDDGADIHEVERNLEDFGYGAGLTVDDIFTTATTQAIKAWQKDHNRERTGTFQPGDVVMINAATVRINSVLGTVGASASGPILTYTDPTIDGRIKLSPAQISQLNSGAEATVRLPNGTDTTASIGTIDPGGEPTNDPSKPSPASAQIEFNDQSVLQGIGLPAVRVTIGTDHVDDALVVPVTALVALPGGGYAVDIDADGTSSLVPVTLGLIADSRAQITGGDIVEGDTVEVAG